MKKLKLSFLSPSIFPIRSSVIFIIFFTYSFQLFAQKSDEQQNRFYAFALDSYLELTKPALENYYLVLTKTAFAAFNPKNPYYFPALSEIEKKYPHEKISAVDTLFEHTFNFLNGHLWDNYTADYERYKGLFQVFTTNYCDCMEKKVKLDDLVDKYSIAQAECEQAISADPIVMQKLGNGLRNMTSGEIISLRKYNAMYVYLNCEIMNRKINKTILDDLNESFGFFLSDYKTDQFKECIKYFLNNKMDSLAYHFPTYKKFLNELNLIKSSYTSDTKLTGAISLNSAEKVNMIIGDDSKVKKRFEVKYKNDRINSIITSIKVLPLVFDEEIKSPPPQMQELKDRAIGSNDGVKDVGIVMPQKNNNHSGIGEVRKTNQGTEIFTKVEIDASYPGGLSAWRNFLEENLRGEVPVIKGAPPGKYTVIIQFVVDVDGSLSDFTSLTNIGYGMEEEAIRVIKKSGKWKPAIDKNITLRAYRIQPITFQVIEEVKPKRN